MLGVRGKGFGRGRRHGVKRWQVYDWRNKLVSGQFLALAAETAAEPIFAALVVDPPSTSVADGHDSLVRCQARSCRIELELDGVILRVRSDIDEAQLTALEAADLRSHDLPASIGAGEDVVL